MTQVHLPHACREMKLFVTDKRVPIEYNSRFREYSIALRGMEARQQLLFCPWCGSPLPTSLREKYFAEMDQLGIDYPNEQPPEHFRDDQWWRRREVDLS